MVRRIRKRLRTILKRDRCERELDLELLAARLGQGVEPRPPVVLRRAPFSRDPALMLEAVERGIERALRDLQDIAGDLLNPLRDRPAVHRAGGQRPKNEQVQRALKQIGLAAPRPSCRLTTTG